MASNGHTHLQQSNTTRPTLPTRLTGSLREGRGTDDNTQFQLTLDDMGSKGNGSLRSNHAIEGSRMEASSSPRGNSDEEVEDYDTLKPEDGTVLPSGNSEGGGDEFQEYEEIKAAGKQEELGIPVTLAQTGKSGTYKLTADDPDIRQILRLGLERKKSSQGNATQRAMRQLVFTRQFTMFDRQNPMGGSSPFHGFYTLFWMGLAFLLIRVAAWNFRKFGNILGKHEIWDIMAKDLLVLAITDGVMVSSTIFGLLFQRLVAKGYFNWERSGWILQNLWQTFFLGAVLSWSFYRNWQWPQMVFIFIHVSVFLMKQHSYAFYNGHLSMVYRRKQLLQGKLKRLQDMTSNVSSHPEHRLERPPPDSPPQTDESETARRRRKAQQSVNLDLTRERSNVASAAETIETNSSLKPEEAELVHEVLQNEIDSLYITLKGKCSVTANYYPSNLTIKNFAEWTIFPTLVYELEYPRQENINWWYILEKTVAFFGGIFVMLVVSQAYMYPPIAAAVRMKERGIPLSERMVEFPWIALDLLLPLLLEQLLSWYVIWECLLNIFAEITCFADRGFYGDWWNCVSWDQWARDWNRPVHNFLLRHVYHSSISTFSISKKTATLVTFFLSACIHELFMFCLFKKLRGYLFALQLAQVPLVALSRTKMFKGHSTLGNVIFWFGLFWGPSLITTLYLVI